MDNIAQERAYPTPYANSSLLPFLLTSLAMQKHTPKTKDNFKTEYDFIVVGAGAAGSVVASRLSEIPCVSVLLLEAGKSPPLLTQVPAISRSFLGSDIDWKYLTAPQKNTGAGLKNRQIPWPSGKAIGGSTVLNAMLNIRGNRENYDNWARQGAIGWSYKDVLPYFKKLEDDDVYFSKNPEFHGSNGPVKVQRPRYNPEMRSAIIESAAGLGIPFIDINGPSQNGLADFTITSNYGTRVSSARAYLVPAENRSNLDIVGKALVTKVLIRNRRATGVEVEHNGQRCLIQARREVILSAGTVNTAQLLMLSGIGPEEHLRKMKVPIIANLPVGMNFHDHCGAILSYTISDRIPQFIKKLKNRSNIKRYIYNRSGPLASTQGVSNLAFLTNNRNASPNAIPDHQLYFIEAQAEIIEQTNPSSQGDKIVNPFENKTTFWCGSQHLNPKSRGSVTLSSTNIHDPPVIDPNYFDIEQDLIDVVEGMKQCDEIMSEAPLKKLEVKPYDVVYPGCEKFVNNTDAYFRCQAQSVVVTLSHQVGTARMGDPRDNRTVVDPYLRVLGIEGLRVVDASVMPFVPSANTYIPTMMIAEKASDIIKQSIGCNK